MKKLLIISITLLILVIVLTFTLVPQLVDRVLNRVYKTAPVNVSQEALALYPKLFIADLHCDALMWNRDLLGRNSYGHVDVPRLIEANVALETFSIVSKTPAGMFRGDNVRDACDMITPLAISGLWPPRAWCSLLRRALYQSEKLANAEKRSGGKLVIIRSRQDLARYEAARRKDPSATAGLLAIEGAQVLEGDPGNVSVLFDAGFRMMSPTHFFDNDMSGSAHGVEKYGLTEKGRRMVRLMQEKGMIIDLAHASPKAIDDILALASRPVVVSHTGVKGVCDWVRNIGDSHMRAVAHTEGVIGITFFGLAVCGENIGQIVKSIRYAVRIAGAEHVALGSDFDGSVAEPFDTTGLILLVDALLKDGFTEREIRLIMGENVLKLLKNTLPLK